LTLTAESAVRMLSRSSPFLVSSVGARGGVRGPYAWLDLLVEYVADSRGGRSTSKIEDDFYVEAKTGFGEQRSLTLTVKILLDRQGEGSVLAATMDREMPSGWSLASSTWRFYGPDLASLRGDGYVALSLRRALGSPKRPRARPTSARVSGPRAR
jgi:hypothetical protein